MTDEEMELTEDDVEDAIAISLEAQKELAVIDAQLAVLDEKSQGLHKEQGKIKEVKLEIANETLPLRERRKALVKAANPNSPPPQKIG